MPRFFSVKNFDSSAMDRHLAALGCDGLIYARRRSHSDVKIAAIAGAWLSLGLEVPEHLRSTAVEWRRAA